MLVMVMKLWNWQTWWGNTSHFSGLVTSRPLQKVVVELVFSEVRATNQSNATLGRGWSKTSDERSEGLVRDNIHWNGM